MRTSEDAFGHLYADYLAHGTACAVVERSDGYIDTIDVRMYFAAYTEWPTHERRALRQVRGRVLDVGCGPGRCCLYLQDQGHDVVGFDNSPRAIRICRDRGVQRVKCASIDTFTAPMGAFDTVLMLGNNFGLAGSPTKTRRMLKRFDNLTSDRGRILAGSADPRMTTDRAHLAYHRANRRRGRLAGQVRVRVRYHQFATPWFDFLIVSPDEMRDLCDGTGWRLTRTVSAGTPLYVGILEKV